MFIFRSFLTFFMTFKNSKTFGSFLGRAQPNWAYEFPDRTGPDTQICRTGPALDIHFKTFTYQITEFHWSSSNWNFSFKKVNKQKRIWNKRNFKSFKKIYFMHLFPPTTRFPLMGFPPSEVVEVTEVKRPGNPRQRKF